MSVEYWFHNSTSRVVADLLATLLPRDEEPWPLELAPHSIEHLDNYVADGDEEAAWFREVDVSRVIVVLCTGKRHGVLESLKKAGIRFINLPETYGRMNRFEQTHFLTGAWTEIVKRTHKAKVGKAFRVASSGRKIEDA